ncbi:hypothetical protein DRQ25_15015 [Candidatus Fermentibacteria bacterium]|nr:MAG: hypothetical protein DRQ25_15015 [Candidatus Fermentibacteria bacterium]
MREIHLEERPTSFKQMVGQKEACQQVGGLGKSEEGIPHTLLFTGPSGCGKTTLARIVRRKLKCADYDFKEVNAAKSRGIDMVRGLEGVVNLAPMAGPCRVWLIDECHQLTADAQGAFLKLLEEPPEHAYFMLATTRPEKLRRAIRTRCTEIKVRNLTEPELVGLVERIAEDRDNALDSVVSAKLGSVADGSARKALVLLQQILGMPDDEAKLTALENADAKATAIEIARAVMAGKPWSKVAPLIKACDEEPEGLRWMMQAYFTSVALGGGKQASRAVDILEEFADNYFDTKKAGLVASCYRACAL